MTLKSLLLPLALCWSSALAADNNITFKQTAITSNIFMLEGEGGFSGGNIVISTGPDGVVMIDDAMPYMLDKLNAQIKQVAGGPVDFLINTHVHGDHAGNNSYFGEHKTRIVAHQNLRDFMHTKGMPTMQGLVPVKPAALPVITYSDAMAFYLNGQQAQLTHAPAAHTDGDTFVHFKEANIIHTGDLFFNGMFPFIDQGSGGSLDGYIAAQKAIYKRCNAETQLVPGHGPLTKRAALKASIDMLEDSKKRIAKWVKKGLSEEAVLKKNPLQKYHKDWHWGFITTEKMTQTIYRALTGKKTLAVKHTH